MNRLLPVTSRVLCIPLSPLFLKSSPITIRSVHSGASSIAMATATLEPKPATLRSAESRVPAAPSPLTPAQVAIVKATVPALQEHGGTITKLFYQNMLAAHPELRNIFNLNSQANGRQPLALAASVLAYAAHIDDLAALRHAVERIAHKHVSLDVQPAQYAIVGEHLLGAIAAVLGDAATPEIVDAWTAAYGMLAAVLTNREAALYQAHETWLGWRKFRVARREAESEDITSFYLVPVDGAKLPAYLPGQYVSVQVYLSRLGVRQSRQYSLSTAPRVEGDYYRISIKREVQEGEYLENGGTGSISNLLYDCYLVGDEVELTHPQGEYFVDPVDPTKAGVPLVLLSTGVGATPNLSILESALRPGATSRPISWLQAARTKARLPFAGTVGQLKQAHPGQISSHIWLRNLGADDQPDADFDHGGSRMDLSQLDREKDLFASNAKAEYFICGPESFMTDTKRKLEAMGVGADRINLELFTTGDVA